MKVLDLQCESEHAFEGWFGSEADFQSQLARGLVECPVCGNTRITKKLSAPRLNLSESKASRQGMPAASQGTRAAREGSPAARTTERTSSQELVAPGSEPRHSVAAATDAKAQEMLAAYWHMAREIVNKTEDVGDQFPDMARQIHHGEIPERAIRGQATPDEARELAEEGIAVMALPLPKAVTEPLH
jgi:hypothetical protein